MGLAMAAKVLLGNHPVGMNIAVMKPHAMNAPMLGMTIELRNLPNLDTDSRALAISLPFRHVRRRRAKTLVFFAMTKKTNDSNC